MRTRTLGYFAAAAAAALCVAGGSAIGAGGASTLTFDSTTVGKVTQVFADDGAGPVLIEGYNPNKGFGEAYVAPGNGGRVLTVQGAAECRRLHLQFANCPGGKATLLSLRLVGTDMPARIVLLDFGGNVWPDEVGLEIAPTGPGNSVVVPFPAGSIVYPDGGTKVGTILVTFKGSGSLDDVQFDCGDGPPPEPPRPPTPRLALVKKASPSKAKVGQNVEYTYELKNIGDVALHDVAVTDDAGTPDDASDDFVAGTVDTLLPGKSASFKVKQVISGALCDAPSGGDSVATLDVTTDLTTGNVVVKVSQSRTVNDNSYGANSSVFWGTKVHTFQNLLGSDKAEFVFTNGDGDVVAQFELDYISAVPSTLLGTYPSGFGTLGVSGGDGKMRVGNPAHVVSYTTSLSDNLNQHPSFRGYTTDSPPEGFAGWDFVNAYTVEIAAAAFGGSGFGSVSVPALHNSPSASGDKGKPSPCEVTNVATATARVGSTSEIVTVTASATIDVEAGKPPKAKKKRRRG